LKREEPTVKVAWIVVGALAVIVGAVWTLQGLGILGGSAMSGHTLWAILGPILAVLGIIGVIFGTRRGTST
jgi:hypothetical protein